MFSWLVYFRLDFLETHKYLLQYVLLTFGDYSLDGMCSRSYCKLDVFMCCYLLSIFFVESRFMFAPVCCVCCSLYVR